LCSPVGPPIRSGYRFPLFDRFKVKNSLVMRPDARYRRWFSDFDGLNEFGFGLGLGASF